MFSSLNIKGSPATQCTPESIKITQKPTTPTRVVSSLAEDLKAYSPVQAFATWPMTYEHKAFRTPRSACLNLMKLRSLSTKMEIIEQYAIKKGRTLRIQDRMTAVVYSREYLEQMVKNLGQEDKMHPSFRKELLKHLANTLRWNPSSHISWNLAHSTLLPGEVVQFENKSFSKKQCLLSAKMIEVRIIFDKLNQFEKKLNSVGKKPDIQAREWASTQTLERLQEIHNHIGEEDKKKPSFRKQWILNLEKTIHLNAAPPAVWDLAHRSLLPGELLRTKKHKLTSDGCLQMLRLAEAHAMKTGSRHAVIPVAPPQAPLLGTSEASRPGSANQRGHRAAIAVRLANRPNPIT